MPSIISEVPKGPHDHSDNHLYGVTNHDNDDIYRGEPPPPAGSSSPSTTSSSSESVTGGGRLGAITAVVELAIARWARAHSTSSSTASVSSVVTTSRSHPTQQRRTRPRLSYLNSLQSERDITARIKAREESRHSPRGFVLYLPPTLEPGDKYAFGTTLEGHGPVPSPSQRGITYTTSLPLILDRLDNALKKSTKARHNQGRIRAHGVAQDHLPIHSLPRPRNIQPDNTQVPTRLASSTNIGKIPEPPKGKHKEPTSIMNQSRKTNNYDMHKAWWLDVSSPNWEDMRSIGKLLHLHPLTLEDILHQDPREKLELFSRLGYYFVVFRAIESQTTRERLQHKDTAELDGHLFNEGVVGESIVYLLVFRDGICTFHFTDISEHVDRVKNRVFRLERVIDMSSDWIAHDILDSIVDSFFPFLEEIEKEVSELEDLVFLEDNDRASPRAQPRVVADSLPPRCDAPKQNPDKEQVESVTVQEKHEQISETNRMHCSLLRSSQFIRRFHRFIHFTVASVLHSRDSRTKPSSTALTLRRIAKTKRLVTSLTRLLATKLEVVAQIRKRLLTPSPSGFGDWGGGVDVAIYMGDVQDHILSLQHSLTHYERMLSQSHPTYLSQLDTNVAKIKSGSDKAVMTLTIISMAVACSQVLIGVFSINVIMPTNASPETPHGPYNIFYIVITLCIVITCAFLSVVRRWWVRAKRKRASML